MLAALSLLVHWVGDGILDAGIPESARFGLCTLCGTLLEIALFILAASFSDWLLSSLLQFEYCVMLDDDVLT